jgi:hypothetical protein
MSRRVYIVEDRHRSSGWAVIFLFAIVFACKDELLIIGLSMFAAYVILTWLVHRERRKALDIVNSAAKSMEYDDAQLESIYGKYDPYTMPLTYPDLPTFPYRDHDDGLRDWK